MKQTHSTVTLKEPGKQEQVVRNSDIAKIGTGGLWQHAARNTVGPSTIQMGRVRQSPNNSVDDGDLDLSQYDIQNIPTELLLEHAGAEKIKLDGLNPMRKRTTSIEK